MIIPDLLGLNDKACFAACQEVEFGNGRSNLKRNVAVPTYEKVHPNVHQGPETDRICQEGTDFA
jgi:hypothetical protein